MILRPRYLDDGLVNTALESLGLTSPTSKSVRQSTSRKRGAQAGANKVVTASIERGRAVEREETFDETDTPLRRLRRAIDGLDQANEVVRLDPSVEATLTLRRVVEVTGDLIPGAAYELAPLLGAMIEALFSGDVESADDLRPEQFAHLFTGAKAETPQPMSLAQEGHLPRLLMVFQPQWLYEADSLEDLEGHMTVLGIVDRLLDLGEDMPLDRYLFPSLTRPIRRMLSRREELEQFLESIADATGRSLSAGDLRFAGPGVVVTPIAVYT